MVKGYHNNEVNFVFKVCNAKRAGAVFLRLWALDLPDFVELFYEPEGGLIHGGGGGGGGGSKEVGETTDIMKQNENIILKKI